jgi:hypothetical protein
MTYSFPGPDHKAVFSDDHAYTTHMWLVRDGAIGTFRDYIDNERMFSFKLNEEGYNRTRAMTVLYMFPRKRSEHFEKIDRTLHWVSSTLETADCIGNILDVHAIDLRENLKPNPEKWEALLKKHGPEIFEQDVSVLRQQFPELMQEEGAHIGTIILERAKGIQEGKRLGLCTRGKPPHQSGHNAVFVLIEPMLSAAIEHLTGAWPARPVAPAEGFHLKFEGDKLVSIEQKWLKLETGSDKIYAA